MANPSPAPSQTTTATPPPKPRRIYLAGPDVFLRDALAFGKTKKDLCRQYGFEGVFPLDTDPGIAGLSKSDAGIKIGQTNENLLRTCQIVIANLTPFRGPSADVGTAYEIGFARALGLLIFAYSNEPAPFLPRTVAWLGQSARQDRNYQFRDPHDMELEDWDLADNLMLESGLISSGGKMFVQKVPPSELFTNLEAFKLCLEQLKSKS